MIPINPSGVHAPMWVLGACGLIFLLAGAWVFPASIRGLVQHGRGRPSCASIRGSTSISTQDQTPAHLLKRVRETIPEAGSDLA